MARIGVQSEELRQEASTVKTGAAEVNDILARLTGQIQTLASTWEGAASAAFQTRWQEWQAGATQVQQAMDAMGVFLDQAALTAVPSSPPSSTESSPPDPMTRT